MTKKVSQFDRHFDAVLAALDLFDCFLDRPKLSVKEIVEITGMTRNRITRILGTLMYRGYVMESLDTGAYTPGPKLMALGNVFVENQNLVVLSRSVLRELALKTGESVSFYIREGQERVVLAREEGTNAIRFSVAVGQRMELHAGAAGKVLLAYAPEAERTILLTSRQLESYTSQTTTNPHTLLEELEKIRSIGYAVSRGERNPDAFALAAPVFERKNQIIGCLALAGPISRLTPETEDSYLADLLEASQLLSERFGHAAES